MFDMIRRISALFSNMFLVIAALTLRSIVGNFLSTLPKISEFENFQSSQCSWSTIQQQYNTLHLLVKKLNKLVHRLVTWSLITYLLFFATYLDHVLSLRGDTVAKLTSTIIVGANLVLCCWFLYISADIPFKVHH